MLFTPETYVETKKENMRGGDGTVILNALTAAGTLPEHSRLISEIILNPGCGIGEHVHEKEAEFFYMLEGELTLTDNGAEMPFKAGECHFCYSGGSHAIKNTGDKTAKLLAIIFTDLD